MKISPARAAAFDALLRVERDSAFATDALDARLDALEKRADSALATELTMGVLRWQRLLDFFLSRYKKSRSAEFDIEVTIALRLGLYQLRLLSRVPGAAVVNDSVELVKRAKKRSAASLVNAILRRAVKDSVIRGPIEPLLSPDLPLAERLGVALSHPDWLVERWLSRFGEQSTRDLLAANNQPPRLTAALLDLQQESAVRNSLAASGFELSPGRWLASAFDLRRAPRAGVVRLRQALGAARITPQDEASQMIPLLLNVLPGHSVLDLCAAPGGKTARLSERAGRGTVVATDLHLHRLRQMRELFGVTGAGNPNLLGLDAMQPLPFSRQFDRVLVDAPCSGTGTLARNPEIRWRLKPADLGALRAKQQAMLRNGLAQLATGGRLVYSTCSLEPEENEQVLAAVLPEFPGARIVCAKEALSPHLRPDSDSGALFDGRNHFRTFPPRHGTDGFFAAAVEISAGPSRC